MAIRAVGVCLREGGSQLALEALAQLTEWLQKQRLEVFFDRAAGAAGDQPAISPAQMGSRADLVVALGGDGTLLRVARELGTRRIPIVGVNLGTLGYLTEFSVDEMLPALERVLAGDFEIQSRQRLEVSVERRGGDVLGSTHALNEAVISTRASTLIDLEARADEAPVTTYHADGLIVSTPTGSTAYSLSAGGPILLPGTQAVLLTPICPHTLTHRPLVLASDSRIEVVVNARGNEVTLTVDGHEQRELHDGDRVRIHRSPHGVELVSSPFHSRFDVLRSKLHWGQR